MFQALLSMLYLTVSDIFALINYVGFATWVRHRDFPRSFLYNLAPFFHSVTHFSDWQLSIGVAVLCLPWLRWKQPELARPIKVNLFFPIAYIICSIFVTVVPMFASPYETRKYAFAFEKARQVHSRQIRSPTGATCLATASSPRGL